MANALGTINTTTEVPDSVSGNTKLSTGDSLVINKTSGLGIKVDTTTPTFPWHDMLGEIIVKTTGAGTPLLAVHRGNVSQYTFTVGDFVYLAFHIPHDYAPGTDLHIHYHWSHIVTTVTGGTVTWRAEISYAKGHNQAAFTAAVTLDTSPAASTTQYQHMISEVQMSAAAPSGSQIDTDDIEPDGLILVRVTLQANAITVSSGGVPDPFLHYADIHYQSTGVGTKSKVSPGFYT